MLTSRPWLYVSVFRRTYIANPHLRARLDKLRFRVPKISTLLPEKLSHSDFLVLAGNTQSQFHTRLSLRAAVGQERYRQVTRLNYQKYSLGDSKHDLESKGGGSTTFGSQVANELRGSWAPFPEHSRGFLYLQQPPPESDLPRSESSIRFRCTHSLVDAFSSDVDVVPVKMSTSRSGSSLSLMNIKIYEAFMAGYDLTLPDGIPWSIPVVLVAGRTSFKFLRLQLLEDKLFSESELEEYEGIYKSTNHDQESNRKSNSLDTLNDVFHIEFNKTAFKVWVTTAKDGVLEGGEEKISQAGNTRIKPGLSTFFGVFLDRRPQYGRKLPYAGAALVRFELAPGSSPTDPILALRIVKITRPVECVIPDYDGYLHMPKEGELFMHGLSGEEKPWMFQLDPSVPTHTAMLSLVPGYTRNTD